MSSPFVLSAAGFYFALAAVGAAWLHLADYSLDCLISSTDQLAWDIGLGLLVGTFILGAWHIAERTIEAANRLTRELTDILPQVSGAGVAVLAATSAIGEEVFFRGALQSAVGPLFATAIFGILHGMFDRRFILWMVFATIAGAIFAMLTVVQGNIVAATVAHAFVNGINLRRMTQETC